MGTRESPKGYPGCLGSSLSSVTDQLCHALSASVSPPVKWVEGRGKGELSSCWQSSWRSAWHVGNPQQTNSSSRSIVSLGLLRD